MSQEQKISIKIIKDGQKSNVTKKSLTISLKQLRQELQIPCNLQFQADDFAIQIQDEEGFVIKDVINKDSEINLLSQKVTETDVNLFVNKKLSKKVQLDTSAPLNEIRVKLNLQSDDLFDFDGFDLDIESENDYNLSDVLKQGQQLHIKSNKEDNNNNNNNSNNNQNSKQIGQNQQSGNTNPPSKNQVQKQQQQQNKNQQQNPIQSTLLPNDQDQDKGQKIIVFLNKQKIDSCKLDINIPLDVVRQALDSIPDEASFFDGQTEIRVNRKQESSFNLFEILKNGNELYLETEKDNSAASRNSVKKVQNNLYSQQDPSKEVYSLVSQDSDQLIKKTPKDYGCQFVKKEGQLDIYLYPPKLNLDQQQLHSARTIMVLGQTGSGKTTLLDAMANYLAGVNIDDTYRYKLVDERSIEKDQAGEHESKTKEVIDYQIKNFRNGQVYRVIDTPGFLDTTGITRDIQITQQIQQLFQSKIDKIDLVCMVCVSSQARLTCTQKWVFNKVLEIFGKDIQDNISILMTFCDGKEPQVLHTLKADNVPYKNYFKFNNSALFESGDDNFTKMFWDMGYQSLKEFFDKLQGFQCKSLKQTKEVLERRQSLETLLTSMRPQIDSGLAQLENARKEMNFLKAFQDQINQAKDFEYEIDTQQFRKVDLSAGIHTTTCQKCNRTCHNGCSYGKNEDKAKCIAMGPNGYCTVCSDKCFWDIHLNLPYVIEYYTKKETKRSDDLYYKYVDATNKKSRSEQVISGLKREFFKIQRTLINQLAKLRDCLQELERIALRPNPLTGMEILTMMKNSEQIEKKPGYQERIKTLDEIIQKYALLEKAAKKDEDILKEWTKDYEVVLDQLNKVDAQNNKEGQSCNIF